MFDIVKNTIREFLRFKIVYIWIVVAIILLFSSYILWTLTIKQWNKTIVDFSLSVIEIFALLMTLFLWAYLLYNEFNKKTVLLVLSKIKHKYYFIIWKYIWFAIIIAILYFVLSIWFYLTLYFNHIDFYFYYILAIILSYFKILVVLAFVMFFSTILNPFLALLSSLFIYFVSHATSFMLFYSQIDKEQHLNNLTKGIIKIIYYILPNFQDLSMKEYFISPRLWDYTNIHFLLSITWWSILYIFILLLLSSIIFSKKEF